MAQEISRTFDLQLAAVIVGIRDEFGHDSYHTIHIFNKTDCPACGHVKILDIAGNVDVAATVADIKSEIDSATAIIRQRMLAAGWTPSPGG